MIEIRLDSTEGQVIGSVSISPTGGLDIYKQMSGRIKNAKGVHCLLYTSISIRKMDVII